MERRRIKERNRWEERCAMRLLSCFSHRCSELLCASVLTEQSYPELSETLEQMAETETLQFRDLAGMMVRKEMNPPLRMIFYANCGGCPSLSSEWEKDLDRFLHKMREHTERMLRDASVLLTLPTWEDEDKTTDLMNRQEAQIRLLDRMLS